MQNQQNRDSPHPFPIISRVIAPLNLNGTLKLREMSSRFKHPNDDQQEEFGTRQRLNRWNAELTLFSRAAARSFLCHPEFYCSSLLLCGGPHYIYFLQLYLKSFLFFFPLLLAQFVLFFSHCFFLVLLLFPYHSFRPFVDCPIQSSLF